MVFAIVLFCWDLYWIIFKAPNCVSNNPNVKHSDQLNTRLPKLFHGLLKQKTFLQTRQSMLSALQKCLSIRFTKIILN